ncbi:MAG: hypothetical protein GF416_08200 [Candidatus Altiarchaeales archaeon]|nr:hypothetical protein [Candidatus Altiarchaeales archaeon]MBD3417096.1 hypothetical protein [Candidatus Altiarchaeales archaeon]
MRLSRLQRGWHKHSRHLRRKLEFGQDPRIFCLSCSDSRVCVHNIFSLREDGNIFEAKNVGGLFSEDAKAAFTYAVNNLDPDFFIVLHHTQCGGYNSLESYETEPEIKRHMVEYGGSHAKYKVEAFLKEKKLKLPDEHFRRLVIEEGCRIQVETLRNFLLLHYPGKYEDLKSGKFRILPLVYDIKSGRVYRVPEELEGSETMDRKEP